MPLSALGHRIIEHVRGWDVEHVFGLKSQSLDANFRKYRERARLSGFAFHDARHTAAMRLAVKRSINPLILYKIFGWKQTKMALTYFNPTASQMAGMLQAARCLRLLVRKTEHVASASLLSVILVARQGLLGRSNLFPG